MDQPISTTSGVDARQRTAGRRLPRLGRLLVEMKVLVTDWLAPCPALTEARVFARPGPRVLVPLGDGPRANDAVKLATALAREQDGQILLVYFLARPAALPNDGLPTEEFVEARHRLEIAAYACRRAGLTVSGEVRYSLDRSEEILNLTDRFRIHQVVLGLDG